jgi:glycosyltransferase involved in cell wall biosynthesis
MVSDLAPLVSVIIPTYNRVNSLRRTLDSLAQQTYPAVRFEVIVVDDGSTDTTPEIRDLAPLPVRYYRQGNQGAAAARNAGAVEARGELLVFLDDDVIVHECFLDALVAGHPRNSRTMTMGQFQPMHEDGHVYARIRARRHRRAMAKQATELPFSACVSNNLCIEKTAFMDIGLWQNALGDGPALWSDVVFGLNAWKCGYTLLVIPEAMAWHCDQWGSNLALSRERALHVARLGVLLFRQLPELKGHIPMFRDKEPIDVRFDSLPLIVRKLFYRVIALALVQDIVQATTRLVERLLPDSQLLEHLYHWQLGASIYKGYHQGLDDE